MKRRQYLAVSHPSARPDLTIKAGSFLLLGQKSESGRSRLGITVTKKVGSAVTRNRIKRQVREFFRHKAPAWPVDLDLVVIARHSAGSKSPAELAADLKKADQKLKHLAVTGPGGPGKSPDEVSAAAPPKAAAAEGPAEAENCQALTWPGRLALGLIRFYQRFVSPLLPPACRFWPTCSQYAAEALKRHGFLYGSYLAGRRLLRCHPFHPGGYDPVPPRGKR